VNFSAYSLLCTCAIQCYTMYLVQIQKCPLESRTGTLYYLTIVVVCSCMVHIIMTGSLYSSFSILKVEYVKVLQAFKQ